jgi:glycosyltransferase involved in cell wall biosynthesis
MQAQAAGCALITSPIAALNETVGNRGAMIEGDWMSAQYAESFANELINKLTNTKEDERMDLKEYARENFSITFLAENWNNMFNILLEDKYIPLLNR